MEENEMKKLSLIIALALLVTIGSVYANWIYNEHNDVADISGSRAITMTSATFEGGLGTYTVTTAGLTLKVDPKPGTSHTTSLVAEGSITVVFTPSQYASDDIKNNAVPTKFSFSSSKPVAEWTYNGEQIFSEIKVDQHEIDWTGTKQADGTFKYEIPAAVVMQHVTLNELNLDTKADYDAYATALQGGLLVITVSDGQATPTT